MTPSYAKEWQAIMNDRDAANEALSRKPIPTPPVIDHDQEWRRYAGRMPVATLRRIA